MAMNGGSTHRRALNHGGSQALLADAVKRNAYNTEINFEQKNPSLNRYKRPCVGRLFAGIFYIK